MRNTVDILGTKIDNITMEKALKTLRCFLDTDTVHTVYTPNSEIMMAAHRDPQLKEILNKGDMVIADGAGVVLASRILGTKLPEKVAGFDLVKNTFEYASRKSIRVFLFGSKPGIAETAAENIVKTFPGVKMVGCRNGYFSTEEESSIIEQINSSNADILLVALGAPKQEKWIHKNINVLKPKVCIGVGGTIDVFSGQTKLAPDFFRKNSLEWLYRLCKEPKRFKRMLDLPRFILLVFYNRLFNNYN